MFVDDLDFEARGGFGGAAGFGWECVQVLVVAADYPSALGLPVVVVYENA